MNVLIVDDHAIVRDGLALMLQDAFKVENVLFASNGKEAIQKAFKYPIDLILLDLSMSYSLEGFDCLKELRSISSETKIIIFSMYDEVEYQRKAFELGADGYLVKRLNGEEIIKSIKEIMDGKLHFKQHAMIAHEPPDWEIPLSPREKEVFIFTVLGHSLQDIADRFNISVKTVENHRRNINKKLGIRKRSEWIELAKKYNLLDP